ncbi:MAG TPA: hypothetical protein VHC48_16915, partial [Puia sp.]|nr:hypothetical protein [Puia sp.]
MKKLLFTFILGFTCFLMSNAQIQKGNVMVGGDITHLDLSLNEGHNFSVVIDPKAAWFIKDNIAIG